MRNNLLEIGFIYGILKYSPQFEISIFVHTFSKKKKNKAFNTLDIIPYIIEIYVCFLRKDPKNSDIKSSFEEEAK